MRWKINGFHTVSFVPDGEQPPAVLVPDATIPIAGSNDEAGNPFWFNGQPSLGFNPLGRVAARGQDV